VPGAYGGQMARFWEGLSTASGRCRPSQRLWGNDTAVYLSPARIVSVQVDQSGVGWSGRHLVQEISDAGFLAAEPVNNFETLFSVV
jgi:hypothetical protein